MEGKAKSVMLSSLKRAFNKHPQAYSDYKKLGKTVLDCTEFFHEKAVVLQSQALAKSRLNIEIILLEENLPSLLEDFRTMTRTLDQIQQLQTESSTEISNVVLITTEFLLVMEEAEA